MIRIRRESETLIYGEYELIFGDHEDIYAYLRHGKDEDYLVVVNMFNKEVDIDYSDYTVDELVLSNYDVDDATETNFTLRPYEARLLKLKR